MAMVGDAQRVSDASAEAGGARGDDDIVDAEFEEADGARP